MPTFAFSLAACVCTLLYRLTKEQNVGNISSESEKRININCIFAIPFAAFCLFLIVGGGGMKGKE